ncbi:MAG TPA: class I SAM-dependent methyltransferase [Streptosporangiaceae bacterium]|nr:class I SAM-dependent methyltransferase [Streptosporangiaceae bacterium]
MEDATPATCQEDGENFLAADEHSRRAASFGAAASAYARHRPDYPVAAIRWALAPLAEIGRPLDTLDLGAGTGKLTAQLAGLSTDAGRVNVVAVEPDPGMLAELRRQVPGVTALEGRAEAIPLPDASVDAVLAGQAAHWFDLDRALPEIARVLRPGGVLAGLWNADDASVDWVVGLHEASGRRTVAPILGPQEQDHATSAWMSEVSKRFFLPAEHSEFGHSHIRTAESMVETLATHSLFLIMEDAQREAALTDVREFLAATPQTASGEFALPLVTLTLRAVRR